MTNNFDIEGSAVFAEKINWHGGFWGKLPLGKNWGIQAELLYIRKGANNIPVDQQAGWSESRIDYDYLDIPVMVYTQTGSFSLLAGVSVGKAIDFQWYDKTAGSRIESVFVKEIWDPGMDFSLIGGVALDLNRFRLAVRYLHALTPTLKDITLTDANGNSIRRENGGHHRNLMLSVGYTLWEKQ